MGYFLCKIIWKSLHLLSISAVQEKQVKFVTQQIEHKLEIETLKQT